MSERASGGLRLVRESVSQQEREGGREGGRAEPASPEDNNVSAFTGSQCPVPSRQEHVASLGA